jgi:ubiquinone/menaquinone biosynthesis C-methylase UbiE
MMMEAQMSGQTEFDEVAFRQFERDGYTRVAEGYGSKTAIITAQANDAILDAARVGQGSRVLDVACGPGLLTSAAIARGGTTSAIDFSPGMVTVAHSNNPTALVQEGDAENLPFNDAQFDAIVCSIGILHFPSPEKAIDEAYRTLKSGGMYAFTCWTPPAVNPFLGIILGSIQEHGIVDIDLPAGPPLWRFSEASECERVLSNAGFTNVTTQEVPLVWQSASPEQFVEEIPNSTGRLGPMLSAQSDEQRAAIEQAIKQHATNYASDDGIRIPSAFVLAAGQKP